MSDIVTQSILLMLILSIILEIEGRKESIRSFFYLSKLIVKKSWKSFHSQARASLGSVNLTVDYSNLRI